MKNQKGFTLMEILIVIVIIAIMSAIAILGYQKVVAGMRDKLAQTRLGVIAEAQSRFKLGMGRGRYATACELAQTTSNTGEKLIPETIAKFDEGCRPIMIGEWQIEDNLGSNTDDRSLRNSFLIKLTKGEERGTGSETIEIGPVGVPPRSTGREATYCIAEDGVLRKSFRNCNRESTPVE